MASQQESPTLEREASMRMGISKKTSATPTCSYIWIVLIALIGHMYLLLLALCFKQSMFPSSVIEFVHM